MISQTVEYSLRAVVVLAQQAGKPCTVERISEITQVPRPYLAKLMQGLVRAGLVQSRRGLHGGFVLAKSPQDLTIWHVVEAVEPFQRIRECPLRIGTHGSDLCPLHRRLDEAMEWVENRFRATALTELLRDPEGRSPLCERVSVVTLSTEIPRPRTTVDESSPPDLGG